MSEIIAKWIASTGIDPSKLIDTSDTEFDHMQTKNDFLEVSNSSDEICNVDNVSQFDLEKPISISSDIKNEDKDNINSTVCILGK